MQEQVPKKRRIENQRLSAPVFCLFKCFSLFTFWRGLATLDDFTKTPRKKDVRNFLAVSKLLGKSQLRTSIPMDIDNRLDHDFAFKILQPSGGDSRSLMIPELSNSYWWSASAVAGQNGKFPIYVLAEEQLEVL